MAAEVQASEMSKVPRKRKPKHNKACKARKKSQREFYQERKEVKGLNSRKMKKLFKKRAKEYNSDDDEEEPSRRAGDLGAQPHGGDEQAASDSSEEDGEAEALDVGGEHGDEGNGGSEDEDHGSKDEITKFTEGCRAFRVSFLKIMKKNISKDPLVSTVLLCFLDFSWIFK